MTRPTPTDSGEAVPADLPAVFGEGRLLEAYRMMTPEQRHIMLQLAELFAPAAVDDRGGRGEVARHGVMIAPRIGTPDTVRLSALFQAHGVRRRFHPLHPDVFEPMRGSGAGSL
jgi:hypothetical protein